MTRSNWKRMIGGAIGLLYFYVSTFFIVQFATYGLYQAFLRIHEPNSLFFGFIPVSDIVATYVAMFWILFNGIMGFVTMRIAFRPRRYAFAQAIKRISKRWPN